MVAAFSWAVNLGTSQRILIGPFFPACFAFFAWTKTNGVTEGRAPFIVQTSACAIQGQYPDPAGYSDEEADSLRIQVQMAFTMQTANAKESLMPRMIFVNLPVADLKKSMAFYTALGFVNNPHFTDETAACMVWSETINAMLLTHDKWRTFTSRPIPPNTSSEVMLALSCDSREAVDAMNQAAADNGGTADINPAQDLGFMYNRNLADLDGHVWEAFWMDPAAIPST
jgi:predicted lactoylglutathione lyase